MALLGSGCPEPGRTFILSAALSEGPRAHPHLLPPSFPPQLSRGLNSILGSGGCTAPSRAVTHCHLAESQWELRGTRAGSTAGCLAMEAHGDEGAFPALLVCQ